MNKPSVQLVLEAIAIALFILCPVVLSSQVVSSGAGGEISAAKGAAVFLGNGIALLIAGFFRPDRPSSFFRWGLASSVACLVARVAFMLTASDVLVIAHVFLQCSTSAFLIVAWYDRIASRHNSDKTQMISLICVFIALLAMVVFVTGFDFAEPFVVASALYGLLFVAKDDAQMKPQEAGFPLSAAALLTLFPFFFSGFSLLFPAFVEQMSPHLSAPWLPGLAMLCAVFLLLAAVFMVRRFVKRPSTVFPLMVIPLFSGALFLPFFLSANLYTAHLAISAFINLCLVIVVSLGPAYASHTFVIGKFRFVCWWRSLCFFGSALGTLLDSFVVSYVDLGAFGDVPVWVFFLYLLVCLLVSAVLGFQSAESSKQVANAPFERACDAVTSRYGLTKREAEVFAMLAQGRTAPYIQKSLFISAGTVNAHIRHIYAKLDIHKREELLDILTKHMS